MDERQRTLTPEEIKEVIQERKNAEKVKMWRARQRLIGSTILGVFGVFKISTVPGPIPPETGVLGLGVSGAEVFWLFAIMVAFGIATVDQFLKAVGRN